MRKRERPCTYSALLVMAASLSSEDKGTVERTLNELLNQECESVHLAIDQVFGMTLRPQFTSLHCVQVAVVLNIKDFWVF